MTEDEHKVRPLYVREKVVGPNLGPVCGASVRPPCLGGAKHVECCQDMGNRCYQDIGYTLPTRQRGGAGVGGLRHMVWRPRLRGIETAPYPPLTPIHPRVHNPLTSPHPPL